MKRKLFNKFILSSFGALSSLCMLSFSSCSDPKPPEPESFQIIEPTQKLTWSTINQETAEAWFNGFQYACPKGTTFDSKKLTIETTFSEEFEFFVDRVNPTNKTFAIRVLYTGFAKNFKSDGYFAFKYDNVPVELPKSTYTIVLLSGVSVHLPADRYATNNLDKDGKCDVLFSGFKYEGYIEDEENLSVTNTFQQQSESESPASFVSKVVNHDPNNKTFDVKVEVSNAMPDRYLVGNFYFFYYGILLEMDDTVEFAMNLQDVKSITKPTGDDTYSEGFVDKSKKTVSLVFKNFCFTGFDSPEGIIVSNKGFEDSCSKQSWDIDYKICNWDLQSKTFDIQVNISQISSLASLDTLIGDFTFEFGGEPIETMEGSFTGQIKSSIPEDLLAFNEDVLSGLKPDADITPFNTLSIPNYVTSIADNAFENDFVFGESSIRFLSFPRTSALTKIGKQAFAGCSGLEQKDLILSNNIQSIGGSAFKDCSGLSGTLSLPKNYIYNKVTINTSAFENCSGFTTIIIPRVVELSGSKTFKGCTKLTTIDFSTWQKDIIPDWLNPKEVTNKEFFADVGSAVCTQESKGVVLLPYETSIQSTWIDKLSNVGGLSISSDSSSIWECIVSESNYGK